MPRFFVQSEQIRGDRITLFGDDARHIAYSLRMAVGETVVICDARSNEYTCTLTEFGDGYVCAAIDSVKENQTEPPFEAHLFQGLPKGDKLDTIIQKAVECGAREITPFESSRCVVHMKPEAEARKTERRGRIALEAAKQCGRGCLPVVHETVTFDRVLEQASAFDLVLFCYEGEGTRSLKTVLGEVLGDFRQGSQTPRIAVIIGSEGGFSIDEAGRAEESGCCMVGLGPRILRTETAGSFVLGCLVYEAEL